MATTLATELIKAGCNINTATILYQPGLGNLATTGTPQASHPSNKATVAVTLTPTSPQMTQRFIQRQDQSGPRCIAIDATYIYVWVALPSSQPGFRALAWNPVNLNAGTAAIPVIADF